MRFDFQFGKNFRWDKAVGCTGIHKKLDFTGAEAIGRISNCRFNVRDTDFYLIFPTTTRVGSRSVWNRLLEFPSSVRVMVRQIGPDSLGITISPSCYRRSHTRKAVRG
jgi:hypothetical protein